MDKITNNTGTTCSHICSDLSEEIEQNNINNHHPALPEIKKNLNFKIEEYQKSSKKFSPAQIDDVIKQQIKEEKSQKIRWKLAVFCMAMRFLLDGMEHRDKR